MRDDKISVCFRYSLHGLLQITDYAWFANKAASSDTCNQMVCTKTKNGHVESHFV